MLGFPLTDDPYCMNLCIQYQKLNPSRFSYHTKEWKFCELSFRTESLSQTKETPQALHLQKLLHENEYPPRTLIIGAPGVGKTALVIELCKRWSCEKLYHEYQYVILLRASNPRIYNAKNEEDFVPLQHRNWLAPIVEANGKGTLFILEGYDELPENQRSQGSIFHQLIQGEELFSEASLIVTTRPWCVREIAKYFPKENQIEILGFTPEGRKLFIAQILHTEDDIEMFSLLIKKFPKVEGWIDIPFYLTILIKIYEEHKHSLVEQKFPNTLTKLYGALVRTLILQFSYKNTKLSKYMPPKSINIPPGEFFKLPREIYKCFLKLCAISYGSFVNYIPLEVEEDCETFDILVEHVEERTCGRSSYYKFLHSSIGEYLTAYSISRLRPKDVRKCFSQMKSYRYTLVLEFLSGFGCVPPDLFVIEPKIHNFTVFHQLCEVDSPEITAASCSTDLIKMHRTYPIPSPADMWSLGRVIGFSKCVWELGFTLRSLENAHLEMLCKGINSVESPSGQIKKLGFQLNNFDEKGLSYILSIKSECLSKISVIHLFGNRLNSLIIPLLCEAFTILHNLKIFLLHHNEITLGDHKHIINALIHYVPRIEQLSFSDLQKDECQLLLHSLKKLKVVEFWQLCPESIKEIVDVIPSKASGSILERLEIHQSTYPVDLNCIRSLPVTLPQSSIRFLVMTNCGINCEITEVIVEAAHRHQRLLTLDLSDNFIRDKGGERLLELGKWIDLDNTSNRNYFSQRTRQRLSSLKQHSGSFRPISATVAKNKKKTSTALKTKHHSK